MEPKKQNSHTFELQKHAQMRVPGIIYATESLLAQIRKDKTLEQLRNVASLPGIVRAAYAMPDAHQGYGFPIGGVGAFDMDDGIISPGGVGYDINCGVRMLRTDWKYSELQDKRKDLLNAIFGEVPAGVGKKGQTRLTKDVLSEVLEKGGRWAAGSGYGTKEDLERTEEYGCMKGADPTNVSDRAFARGMPQLGTLGSGNHFLEIQRVDKVFNESVAKRFGLFEGQATVMIHCGSRGLGHQVASDYIKKMEEKFGIAGLPDRELVNAPLASELAHDYFGAMAGSINFAFANRQMIAHWVREVFQKIMGTSEGMGQVYDVCHNIAKFEKHLVDGSTRTLCVHRKGATRSFGPGRDEIPDVYRQTGQPVIIPGSMGTASYVLCGTKEAEEKSFGSTAHGAGRVMSRHEALRRFRGEKITSELAQKGILVKGSSMKGIAEEAYQVYKDIDEVVKVSDSAGLGRLVARVVPAAVMKG